MLLLMCLYESIGGGWYGPDKEAWYLGIIGGGYWSPEIDFRWSGIEYCVSFLAGSER